jgi:hypothetical protein
MIEAYNRLIKPLEWQVEKTACHHDPTASICLEPFPG